MINYKIGYIDKKDYTLCIGEPEIGYTDIILVEDIHIAYKDIFVTAVVYSTDIKKKLTASLPMTDYHFGGKFDFRSYFE